MGAPAIDPAIHGILRVEPSAARDQLLLTFETPGSAPVRATQALGDLDEIRALVEHLAYTPMCQRVATLERIARHFGSRVLPEPMTAALANWAMAAHQRALLFLDVVDPELAAQGHPHPDGPVLSWAHDLPWELIPSYLGMAHAVLVARLSPKPVYTHQPDEGDPVDDRPGDDPDRPGDDQNAAMPSGSDTDDSPGDTGARPSDDWHDDASDDPTWIRPGLRPMGVANVANMPPPMVMDSMRGITGDRARVLMAGWPSSREPMSAGVTRELTELARLFDTDHIEVSSLRAPGSEQLADQLSEFQPNIMYLAAGQDMPDAQPFLDAIRSSSSLAIVTLGMGRSSLTAGRLCADIDAAVIGWQGAINDEVATGFSLALYSALIGRASLETAMRDAWNATGWREGHATALPCLWLPNIEARDWTLYRTRQLSPAPEPPEPGAPPDGPFGPYRGGTAPLPFTPPTRGQKDNTRRPELLELDVPGAINPALLVNGSPPVRGLTVHLDRGPTEVRVELSCDSGAGVSTVRKSMTLAAGSHLIPTADLHFPVLYELVRQRSGRRHINLCVTVSTSDDRVFAETTRSILWMGHNEWMDNPDLWAYIPAFVLPESRGVLEVLKYAEGVLRTIGDPSDSFDGYQSGDPDKVHRQIRALFQTLRDEPLEISYINPPASPVYLPGMSRVFGQRVRFVDEVIAARRGTCHDLALVMASCAEYVGIYPIVVLLPSHTFCGYWTQPEAHRRFWSARAARGRMSHKSEAWVFESRQELADLVRDKDIALLEITNATSRETGFDKARKHGDAYADGRSFDAVIDIYASRHAVAPLFADIATLK